MMCFCSVILDQFRFADILSRVFMPMFNSELVTFSVSFSLFLSYCFGWFYRMIFGFSLPLSSFWNSVCIKQKLKDWKNVSLKQSGLVGFFW